MSTPASNASSFNSVLHGSQPTHTQAYRGRQAAGGDGSAERVIARFRPHARVLFFPSILVVAVCGATGYFAFSFPEQWQNIAVFAGAAVLVIFGWLLPLLSWLASRYTVTTKRLIIRSGFLVSTRQEIPFNRGYDLAVRKSWLQSLFRSGDVRITRAPGQVAVLRDVPEADLVMTVIGDLLEDGVVWASASRPAGSAGAVAFSGQNNTDPRGAYNNGAYPGGDNQGSAGYRDAAISPDGETTPPKKRRRRDRVKTTNHHDDNDQTVVLPRQ